MLLADEPTGNLDSVSAQLVLDLIVRLHREQRMTLVLVTHDMSIARRASRTLSMKDGQFLRRLRRMTFLTVVMRGLMRRPVRTGLTLVGHLHRYRRRRRTRRHLPRL